MQHRYVPDLGDFSKFAVIEALARPGAPGGLTVGLVWYLTDPETDVHGRLRTNDGRHRAYLTLPPRQAARFRDCAPELYDRMRAILESGVRDVAAYRTRRVLGAAGAVRWFEAPLSYRRLGAAGARTRDARGAHRRDWLARALAAVDARELVLLDPDNGLLPARAAPDGPTGPKYATLDECARFFDGGRRSLVVYQHAHRRAPAEVQIRAALRALAGHLGAPAAAPFALRFHRGTARAYLVVPAPRHAAILRGRAQAMIDGRWGRHGHFSLVGSRPDPRADSDPGGDTHAVLPHAGPR